MTLTATAANAGKLSEATIKSECKSAGGTCHHDAESGLSSCIYKDIYGTQCVDYYLDGEWIPRADGTPQGPKSTPLRQSQIKGCRNHPQCPQRRHHR
jgi:hypothetical protein